MPLKSSPPKVPRYVTYFRSKTRMPAAVATSYGRTIALVSIASQTKYAARCASRPKRLGARRPACQPTTRATMNLEALRVQLSQAVNRQRLVDTAVQLVAVPSPTGSAGAAADTLAQILRQDGFAVERPVAGHPDAPAVIAAPRRPSGGSYSAI